MSNRAQPGKLRRELRFSKSLVEANLQNLGQSLSQVRPLLEALNAPDGLLGLFGSELILLEKALGIGSGLPAVTLVGELVSTKTVPANTKISYGYLAETQRSTNLGLVAIGFSDGIPRAATNKVQVAIGSKNYESLGRIAMDQLVINLGDDTPALGSEVSFFTGDYTLADWAETTGFSQLEIIGRITSRVNRVWVE